MAGLRYETTPEEAKRIEDTIIAALRDYAVRHKISNPIIRDIIPSEDLKGATAVGVSGHIWRQSVSAYSALTVYSGENDDDRGFCIFKISNTLATPLTVAIKFYEGIGRTALRDFVQVEHAWLNVNRTAYFNVEDAIFYGVKKGYNIDVLGGENSGTDGIILGGKVVEPLGKTLAPKAMI